jgi:predicted outer membrane protein
MTFKPAIWRPIAVVLSAINLVAVGFAAGESQPWHAGVHAALALAFGLWAQRLQRGPAAGSEQLQAGLESLEAEVGRLGQDMSELQERLDFTERMLAQHAEARRIDPQR